MVRCLLVSKITLALHGEGTLTIVENAEADRLTRMGYCTYQDRSTHAMGNLNAYTLSVCLHNYFNSPEFPDSSHNACATSTLRVRVRHASPASQRSPCAAFFHIRPSSSTVERSAHNRWVAGSNPVSGHQYAATES